MQLATGDRVEFVANDSPRLDPPASDAVAVATGPGPKAAGPGGQGALMTSHLIVTLQAVRCGTVTVHWIDCSGTGC
ncbi:MAG: hypothetical protein ACR2NJ_04775 [Acidimicrobiales bacterium]